VAGKQEEQVARRRTAADEARRRRAARAEASAMRSTSTPAARLLPLLLRLLVVTLHYRSVARISSPTAVKLNAWQTRRRSDQICSWRHLLRRGSALRGLEAARASMQRAGGAGSVHASHAALCTLSIP
jgi:hypothetical protein